jgi:hypothetical protein
MNLTFKVKCPNLACFLLLVAITLLFLNGLSSNLNTIIFKAVTLLLLNGLPSYYNRKFFRILTSCISNLIDLGLIMTLTLKVKLMNFHWFLHYLTCIDMCIYFNIIFLCIKYEFVYIYCLRWDYQIHAFQWVLIKQVKQKS